MTMKVTPIPRVEPTVKVVLSPKQSTYDRLTQYQAMYREQQGVDVELKLLLEQMLLDFMADDKGFQKYLKTSAATTKDGEKKATKPVAPAPAPAAAVPSATQATASLATAVPAPSATQATASLATAVPAPSATQATASLATAVPAPSATQATASLATAVPAPSATQATASLATAVPAPSATQATASLATQPSSLASSAPSVRPVQSGSLFGNSSLNR